MKQKIVLTIFLFVLIGSNANAQNFPTGLLFDRKAYEATPSVPPTKDFERIPEAFSLQQYCPTPGNQQAQGSCVGWATTYGARTIMAAVRGNMTNAEDIAAEALSPSYVFNQINEEGDCDKGSFLVKSLAVLYQQGCDQLKNYPYQCSQTKPDEVSQQRAASFKINDVFRLAAENTSLTQLAIIKRALTNKKPVVIGIECYLSFMQPCVGQTFWTGQRDSLIGGHAMVIVGFDNRITEGGAFLLMNSWGTRWGKGGFIWVRYKDLLDITKEYFIMSDVPTRLKKSPNNQSPPQLPVSTEQKQLSGSFKLVSDNLNEMSAEMTTNATRDLKVVSSEPTYRLTKPYPSGTQFRIYMTNQVPAYVYILGYGSVTKHVEVIFPFEQYSPYFPFKNGQLALPDADHFVALDENVGKDDLCVLYSTEALEIDKIREAIENAPYLTFSQKLKSVLKDKIVSSGVQYEKNSMTFSATFSGSASVVPIVVEVDHVR